MHIHAKGIDGYMMDNAPGYAIDNAPRYAIDNTPDAQWIMCIHVDIVMVLIPYFVLNGFIDLKTDYLSTDKETSCDSIMSQV